MVFSPLKNIFNILTSNTKTTQDTRKRKLDSEFSEECETVTISNKRIKCSLSEESTIVPSSPISYKVAQPPCRQCQE